MDKTADQIAAGLSGFEREWLTGWKGPPGAAFNVTATGLLRKGLLHGPTNWTLNAKGVEVLAILQEQSNAKE